MHTYRNAYTSAHERVDANPHIHSRVSVFSIYRKTSNRAPLSNWMPTLIDHHFDIILSLRPIISIDQKKRVHKIVLIINYLQQ